MRKHREIYLHSIRMSVQCIRTSVQCIQAKTTWLPTLTKSSRYFASVLFSRNSASVKFPANKTLAKISEFTVPKSRVLAQINYAHKSFHWMHLLIKTISCGLFNLHFWYLDWIQYIVTRLILLYDRKRWLELGESLDLLWIVSLKKQTTTYTM